MAGAGGIIPCTAGAGRRGSALAEDLGFAATSDFVEDSVVDLVSVVPLGSAAVEGLVTEVDSAMAVATVEVASPAGADVAKRENTKLQKPNTRETPRFKLQTGLELGSWSFSGVWFFVFGVCEAVESSRHFITAFYRPLL